MKECSANEIEPLNIALSRFGEVYCSPKWSSKTGYPRIPRSRLYFIKEGSGYLKTETQEILMQPGYAYLIPAGLYHEYGCSGMKKFYLLFRVQSRGTKDILADVGQICRIRYDPEDYSAFLSCYEKEDSVSVLQLRLLLIKTIVRMLRENKISPPPLNPHSELVNKAIAYIESEARSNLTVRSVADHLFVSENKLRLAFRSDTGVSIGQYIDETVLKKAKRLLTDPDLSLSQIGAVLGFCDQFYLSRQFKRRFGVTPSAYRKSVLDPKR